VELFRWGVQRMLLCHGGKKIRGTTPTPGRREKNWEESPRQRAGNKTVKKTKIEEGKRGEEKSLSRTTL